jgi:hypothetical protein
MTLDVMLGKLLEIRKELQTMKPGEERWFQPDKTFRAVRVRCGDMMFCITDELVRPDINIWRPLEQIASGILYLQYKE